MSFVYRQVSVPSRNAQLNKFYTSESPRQNSAFRITKLTVLRRKGTTIINAICLFHFSTRERRTSVPNLTNGLKFSKWQFLWQWVQVNAIVRFRLTDPCGATSLEGDQLVPRVTILFLTPFITGGFPHRPDFVMAVSAVLYEGLEHVSRRPVFVFKHTK
jgi:hypothetical protein